MGRVSNAKERLMEAVSELIWTGSYSNTTIDQICEKAGVKKGSFYYFFDSKCDLAVAAVETRWQAWRPEMDAIFSAAVPPLERLKKYYESNYLFQSEMKAKYGRVLGCAHLALGSEVCTHEDSLRRKIENILTEKRKYLESAIRDAHASGVIHAPDAEAKARMIQAYYQGLLTQARIQNDAKVLRDAAQGVFMILGVKERRAPAANSNVSLQV